jgi:preprotein translocase subunit SecD
VIFSFKNEGATAFGDFTQKNVGRYLAITLDKRVLSAPVIQSPIIGGQGRITGRFQLEEVRNIVIQLKYGALPVPLKVVQNRTVGPTLGADSVRKSIVAGAIGLTLVAAFMILYYRMPGVVATLALLVYAAVSFAAFKMIPVVLTLAGIAGFILSIGMAVDANILIFERMREELRAGRSMASALEAGFSRAWTSIVDANVATLITCVILFWFGATFGASVIQGFALTLGVGVLVSMFSAIFVTRTFLRVVQGIGALPADGLFGLANRPPPRPSATSVSA